MLRNEVNEAIQFSRSEKRGIAVLVILCFMSGAYSYFVPEYISRREIARFEGEIQNFRSMQEVNGIALKDSSRMAAPSYSVDQERVAVYEPQGQASAKVSFRADEEAVPSHINITVDDARAIIKSGLLPPEIAYRLVRFREESGGFHSANQVRDIYGMTDTLYNKVKDKIVLEKTDLRKVPVNSASVEELINHPYISKGLANQIVNFRTRVKSFESREDLLRLYFMDEALLEKLMPYLTFY